MDGPRLRLSLACSGSAESQELKHNGRRTAALREDLFWERKSGGPNAARGSLGLSTFYLEWAHCSLLICLDLFVKAQVCKFCGFPPTHFQRRSKLRQTRRDSSSLVRTWVLHLSLCADVNPSLKRLCWLYHPQENSTCF